MTNRERILAEFLDLIQLPCPSGQERPAADYLIPKLKDLGGEVIEDAKSKAATKGDTGNIIANFKGGLPNAKKILISAHLDCVPNCLDIKPRFENGLIKSDGTTILGADDKAGVAAIMEALRCLKERQIPHGDLQILFTISEEKGLGGTKNLDKSLLNADFAYILDAGARPGVIVNNAPGLSIITAEIYGKAAHAGRAPESGVNAIMKAAEILNGITCGRIDSETTSNIGLIKGGTALNVVPDYVVVSAECRSLDPAKLDQAAADLAAAFKIGGEKIKVRVETNLIKSHEPFKLSADAPCIAPARKAAADLGLTPELASAGGYTDANMLNAYGIPCVVLSTGAAKIHTVEEYIEEKFICQNAEWLLETIKHIAK